MPPAPAEFADALVLTGPTGSGKSAVALVLAERHGCEILAMDSMTLYRGMDIGTAKPTAEDRARVPHHLLDLLDPWESGDVAWWLERAAEACRDIGARGRRPMFVGGTPLYLKALLHGLFDGPGSDPTVRGELEVEAGRIGQEAMHRRLAEVDPTAAARLHPNDLRRVVRALEVFAVSGRPISSFQTNWDAAAAPLPCVVLEWPRDELYRRIETRIDGMLAGGWLDEVRRLVSLPRSLSKAAAQALGYGELMVYLNDGGGWDEAVATIKTRTRQFAKRQLTWFRRLPECVPVPASEPDAAGRVWRAWNFPRG